VSVANGNDSSSDDLFGRNCMGAGVAGAGEGSERSAALDRAPHENVIKHSVSKVTGRAAAALQNHAPTNNSDRVRTYV
jgi:hypothetical protein